MNLSWRNVNFVAKALKVILIVVCSNFILLYWNITLILVFAFPLLSIEKNTNDVPFFFFFLAWGRGKTILEESREVRQADLARC